MKTHGMLFNADMMRAWIREVECPGTGKRMTRRPVKPQPEHGLSPCHWSQSGWATVNADGGCNCDNVRALAPGDLIWAKENLRGDGQPGNRREGIVRYALDGEMSLDCRSGVKSDVIWEWKRSTLPARFCPRWASRLTIRVTDVRVERLEDISDDDCVAEGIPRNPAYRIPDGGKLTLSRPCGTFLDMWRGLYGTTDQWVWVYEGVPMLKNVDEVAT